MAVSSLPKVRLSKKTHRGDRRILLRFEYDKNLISTVKSIPGRAWSKSLNSWHVADTSEKLALVLKSLKGKAEVTAVDLGQFQPKNRQEKTTKKIRSTKIIFSEKQGVLNAYTRYLEGKRYSESTVKTYSSFLGDFLSYLKDRPLKLVNNRDVELFVERVFVPKKTSISTHRQFISAMKHFKVFYPDCGLDELELSRPKKDRKLPIVLSVEEVMDILRCTKNLKHRAILGLIYSCGLRIGELLNLELRHIDIDRRQLIVKNAKGRKDRHVVLAETFLPLLANYCQTYRPQRYFAEGVDGGKYSSESVRAFLKRSCQAAKIGKHVTPHTLRHSYATHLLENGIDVRYIQELLGHAKPETTMLYTHVSRKDLLRIKSPLDEAMKRSHLGGKKDGSGAHSQNNFLL